MERSARRHRAIREHHARRESLWHAAATTAVCALGLFVAALWWGAPARAAEPLPSSPAIIRITGSIGREVYSDEDRAWNVFVFYPDQPVNSEEQDEPVKRLALGEYPNAKKRFIEGLARTGERIVIEGTLYAAGRVAKTAVLVEIKTIRRAHKDDSETPVVVSRD